MHQFIGETWDPTTKYQVSLSQMERQPMAENFTTIFPETHVYVILAQLYIKEVLKKFGEKESNTMLKELRELHTENACPYEREFIIWRKNLWENCWKKIFIEPLRQEDVQLVSLCDKILQWRKQVFKSIAEGNDAAICNVGPIFWRHRYRKCINTCRNGRYIHMLLKGKIAELTVKLDLSI